MDLGRGVVSHERGTPVCTAWSGRRLGFRIQVVGCKVQCFEMSGPISPHSGRDCVKSLRSSYSGLYPQSVMDLTPLPPRQDDLGDAGVKRAALRLGDYNHISFIHHMGAYDGFIKDS